MIRQPTLGGPYISSYTIKRSMSAPAKQDPAGKKNRSAAADGKVYFRSDFYNAMIVPLESCCYGGCPRGMCFSMNECTCHML